MNFTYYLKEFIKTSEKAYLQSGLSSKPRKLFFDHLPKCGGSFLNNYILKHYRPEKVFRIAPITRGVSIEEQVQTFLNKPEEERYAYDLIYGHHTFQLMDHINPNSFKITMLREPVDRIISHYYFVKRAKNHHLHKTITLNQMSLEEYVVSGLTEELDNWYVQHFSGWDSTKVNADPENALACAKRGLSRFDCVGVLSEMDHFISVLKKEASLKGALTGKKVNKTDGRPKVSDVSPKALGVIERMNSLDIALYEWALKNRTPLNSDEQDEQFRTADRTPGH